jgi:hypothetical protein
MGCFVTAFSGTVHIGLSTAIEGYHLPDGTFRYSPEYISKLLGYARNYISQLSKKSAKKLKALHDKGFTGEQIQLKVVRPTGGKLKCAVAVIFCQRKVFFSVS